MGKGPKAAPAHAEAVQGELIQETPQPAAQPTAHLDEPGPGATVERGALTVRGWAIFPSGPTARVEAFLGERSLGLAHLGVARPDLRTVSDLPHASIAGFALTADTTAWPGPDGEVPLRVVAESVAGETLELATATIRLAPAPSPSAPRPALRPPAARARPGRRVLVCTHQLCLGGASRYLLELLRELLRQESIDPVVLSPIGGPLRPELEALGIPVHVSGAVPIDDLDAHDGRLEELLAWAAPQEFEVAFVNTASPLSVAGAELAGLLGIPAVWAIHESFEPTVLWAACSAEVRQRAAETLAEAAVAVFEAEATRKIYEAHLPAERSVTLPYGLDLEPIDAQRTGFDRERERRRLGIPADADVLICAGTIEPRKAQAQLAQAFDLIADRYPAAVLVLAGATAGPDSEALAEWARSSRSGERLRLVPTTPDIHSWYGASDVLVCASRIESLPRAALEAMAWEKPVLATKIFGLPELIEDGANGWLCEPGDTAALAAALDRVLATDRETRRRLGAAARALIERRHRPEPYARRIADLLSREPALPAGSRRG